MSPLAAIGKRHRLKANGQMAWAPSTPPLAARYASYLLFDAEREQGPQGNLYVDRGSATNSCQSRQSWQSVRSLSTSTSQQLMMRAKVDPTSLEPASLPEFIAGGRQWDDSSSTRMLGSPT